MCRKSLTKNSAKHQWGECKDLNTSPKRHRKCKNGPTCLFRKYNSCEFLHTEAWEEEVRNSELEILQMMNDGQGAKLSYLK